MNHLIIPIFIMNRGCPNRCIFCNERITAGDYPLHITGDFFRNTVDAYLASAKGHFTRTQIAFYGGNFTGLDLASQKELLSFALPYVEDGRVHSLRLSARPDHLEEASLHFLFSQGVRTIEIGAQSLSDDVLSRSERGHGSDDVRQAVSLLKKEGFETGLHLMAGLPGDSPEQFFRTIEETISLRPDTVRLHPTIVFRDTTLARLFNDGLYVPLSLHQAVSLCGIALLRFKKTGIPVIRLGLQATKEMLKQNNIVAGPFHPAFRSLVEEAIFRHLAILLLNTIPSKQGKIDLYSSPSDISRLRGLNNRTTDYLNIYIQDSDLSIRHDDTLEKDTLRVKAGEIDHALSVTECVDTLITILKNEADVSSAPHRNTSLDAEPADS